jgi:hypothetical protein
MTNFLEPLNLARFLRRLYVLVSGPGLAGSQLCELGGLDIPSAGLSARSGQLNRKGNRQVVSGGHAWTVLQSGACTVRRLQAVQCARHWWKQPLPSVDTEAVKQLSGIVHSSQTTHGFMKNVVGSDRQTYESIVWPADTIPSHAGTARNMLMTGIYISRR